MLFRSDKGVPQLVWRNDGNVVIFAVAAEHIGAVAFGGTPKNLTETRPLREKGAGFECLFFPVKPLLQLKEKF